MCCFKVLFSEGLIAPQTRWLSFPSCLHVLLQNHGPVLNFLKTEIDESRGQKAKKLYDELLDLDNLLAFRMIYFLVGQTKHLNLALQSNTITIDAAVQKVAEARQNICLEYLMDSIGIDGGSFEGCKWVHIMGDHGRPKQMLPKYTSLLWPPYSWSGTAALFVLLARIRYDNQP